eukprot:scaffold111433_cov18-Tisochrysis_lutea.AAC.3
MVGGGVFSHRKALRAHLARLGVPANPSDDHVIGRGSLQWTVQPASQAAEGWSALVIRLPGECVPFHWPVLYARPPIAMPVLYARPPIAMPVLYARPPIAMCTCADTFVQRVVERFNPPTSPPIKHRWKDSSEEEQRVAASGVDTLPVHLVRLLQLPCHRCPAFKLLTYYGNTKERAKKREGWSKPNAFHVCITSYTLVLSPCQWPQRQGCQRVKTIIVKFDVQIVLLPSNFWGAVRPRAFYNYAL